MIETLPPTAPDRRPPQTRLAVAIGEPFPLLRAGITLTLRQAGMVVASDVGDAGKAAREAASARATLLVLGDDGNGDAPGAVAAYKQAVPGGRVVVLVSDATRQRVTDLVGAGVDALLTRQTGGEELLDAVRQVLGGAHVVAPSLVPVLAAAVADGLRPRNPGAAAAPSPLTRKELEVLRALADGASNREISERLYLSMATVKTHLAHVYAKLGVPDRHAAVAAAFARGLLGE